MFFSMTCDYEKTKSEINVKETKLTKSASNKSCLFQNFVNRDRGSVIPCRLIVDPHEWLNEISAVPNWRPANLISPVHTQESFSGTLKEVLLNIGTILCLD